MKQTIMTFCKIKTALLAALLSAMLFSCGGTTGPLAGISGTGVVWGAITGFGSIYVNGVRYDIDQANIEVDGEPNATQEQLAIGMFVRLEATTFDDGTGIASAVLYDDEVEGPISSIEDDPDPTIRRLQIFGYNVVVDQASTIFDGTSFDALEIQLLVEVSGFRDTSTNTIFATRIESRGALEVGSEVELKGVIQNLSPAVSFTINGITIDISSIQADDLEDLESGLRDGVFVEVEGIYLGENSIQAREIEAEDAEQEDIEDGEGEFSLQGIVTRFTSVADFEVNGIKVDASAIPLAITNGLAMGVRLEVQGQLVSGVIVASQLEVADGEDEEDEEEDEDEEDEEDG